MRNGRFSVPSRALSENGPGLGDEGAQLSRTASYCFAIIAIICYISPESRPYHLALPAWFAASDIGISCLSDSNCERQHLPLLVASSSNGISTAVAGRWTYLTTEPRMKTFLTALCEGRSAHVMQCHVMVRSVQYNIPGGDISAPR